jgi:protein-L-isoaspartate(D-aspartate) O-methyltransferase
MDPAARKDLDRLIDEIEWEVRATAAYTGRKALSPRVLGAMRRVARHDFVDAAERGSAYGNFPLPIGHGQTISQPYIVAIMTELLEIAPGNRVLEVGTGSGYQAAVLAELAGEVYSLEIIPELAEAARERLAGIGYTNVWVRQGNGRLGWPEQAPFDAIMVTAASESVPPALTAQLKEGGRLIVPVGGRWGGQELLLLSRDRDGRIGERSLLPVAFVPLVGRNTEPDR